MKDAETPKAAFAAWEAVPSLAALEGLIDARATAIVRRAIEALGETAPASRESEWLEAAADYFDGKMAAYPLAPAEHPALAIAAERDEADALNFKCKEETARAWIAEASERRRADRAEGLVAMHLEGHRQSDMDVVALSKHLADYEADHSAVLAGECAPDERHCSCVPHLRAEVERLRAIEAASRHFMFPGGTRTLQELSDDAKRLSDALLAKINKED